MYLPHIDSFRAIAILVIIAGHCIWAFSWESSPTTKNSLADLLENGTVLFVFISGYLFQYLSASYQYRSYLVKKLKNVILPFMVISIPALFYSVLKNDPTLQYPQLTGHSTVYQLLWFLVTGGAHINYPLWFIPMISLFFLFAPVFFLFNRHPKLYFIIGLLLPLSLLLHRPPHPNLNTLHLALYYLPAYLIGMCACQYRRQVDKFCLRYFYPLLLLFVIAVICQFNYLSVHGNLTTTSLFSFQSGFIDWLYLQKILLCFVLLGLGLKFTDSISTPLAPLADMSFTLFFLHGYFLFAFKLICRWEVFEGSIIYVSLLFLGVLALCVAFALVGRRLLGRRSRMIIGC
ncbi:MAG: acyltransferase [Pseudomonadales bacterium]|nr:acyltransferase [Pseudomonadales bacterium]